MPEISYIHFIKKGFVPGIRSGIHNNLIPINRNVEEELEAVDYINL
jgi:hypothetical protein